MRRRTLTLAVLGLALSAASMAQIGGIASRAFGARAWREPVATTGALPATGNRLNDVRMVAADLSLWAWDGDSWEQIATGEGGGGGGPSTPTGPAGGDLTGTYPDPTIAADAVTLGVDTVGGYAGSATEGGPATSALTALTADTATTASTATMATTATTASALAADGANCSAGSYPLGVDPTGAAQSCTALPASGVTAHAALTGLAADDHTQYALLAGRAGGQTLIGGTSSGTLALKSAAANPAFTLTGSAMIVPASNTVNQVTGPSEFGIRFGGGNVGNAVGFWFGDGAGTAYFLCDGNTNSCTVKANAALGWGNASGGASDQLAMRSPAQGVMSLTDPSTGGPGAIRILRRERTTTTIADNGAGGSPAASTLTPATSYIELTCADADGCSVTLDETGAQPGQMLTMAAVGGAGSVTIADTAGVSELAGAWVGGADDTLTVIYGGDRWRETGRSNN